MKSRIITFVFIVTAFGSGLAWNARATSSPDEFEEAVQKIIDADPRIQMINAATEENIPSTLVRRNSTGNVELGRVSGVFFNLYGNGEGFASVTLSPFSYLESDDPTDIKNAVNNLITHLNNSRTGG